MRLHIIYHSVHIKNKASGGFYRMLHEIIQAVYNQINEFYQKNGRRFRLRRFRHLR